MIYLMDTAIQRLNNRGQMNNWLDLNSRDEFR